MFLGLSLQLKRLAIGEGEIIKWILPNFVKPGNQGSYLQKFGYDSLNYWDLYVDVPSDKA